MAERAQDRPAQPQAGQGLHASRRKRVGRGEGSGIGKTSGRGHKGAGPRAGAKTQAELRGRADADPHADAQAARPAHEEVDAVREVPHAHPAGEPAATSRQRFDKGAEVTPDTPAREPAWPRAATCRSRSSAQGELTQGAHRARPRLLRHRAREDRGRRRQRAADRGPSSVLKTFMSSFRGPRDRKKIAFTAAMLLLTRSGAYIPRPASRSRLDDISEKPTATTSWGSSTSSRAACWSASRSSRSGSCPTSWRRSSCS